MGVTESPVLPGTSLNCHYIQHKNKKLKSFNSILGVLGFCLGFKNTLLLKMVGISDSHFSYFYKTFKFSCK